MIIQRQIILISAFCLLVVLLFLFFIISPTTKSIKDDSLKFMAIEKNLALINNKSNSIIDMKLSCQVNNKDLEKSESIFINRDVPVSLIKFFEDEAERVNLNISIFPVSLKEIDDDIWPFVSFRFNLLGSYMNFMRFFERIETSPLLIEIQDLSIKKVDLMQLGQEDYNELSTNDVTAILNIRAFAK